MTTSFGGGMARSGAVCGAVTGALMALGMRYGVSSPSARIRRARCNLKARAFMERFTEKAGTTACEELLGFNLGREKGDRDAFSTACPRAVRTAGEILEDML